MGKIHVYHYPRCSTCKKALRWLDEAGVDYQPHHIVEDTPSEEMLLDLIQRSDLPLKRWFNTSGQKYRDMNLKDQVDDMTPEEAARLLASDGMLIKRPLITDGEKVTLGFSEKEYQQWRT